MYTQSNDGKQLNIRTMGTGERWITYHKVSRTQLVYQRKTKSRELKEFVLKLMN